MGEKVPERTYIYQNTLQTCIFSRGADTLAPFPSRSLRLTRNAARGRPRRPAPLAYPPAPAPYSSSLTGSPHVTWLPDSSGSWIASPNSGPGAGGG